MKKLYLIIPILFLFILLSKVYGSEINIPGTSNVIYSSLTELFKKDLLFTPSSISNIKSEISKYNYYIVVLKGAGIGQIYLFNNVNDLKICYNNSINSNTSILHKQYSIFGNSGVELNTLFEHNSTTIIDKSNLTGLNNISTNIDLYNSNFVDKIYTYTSPYFDFEFIENQDQKSGVINVFQNKQLPEGAMKFYLPPGETDIYNGFNYFTKIDVFQEGIYKFYVTKKGQVLELIEIEINFTSDLISSYHIIKVIDLVSNSCSFNLDNKSNFSEDEVIQYQPFKLNDIRNKWVDFNTSISFNYNTDITFCIFNKKTGNRYNYKSFNISELANPDIILNYKIEDDLQSAIITATKVNVTSSLKLFYQPPDTLDKIEVTTDTIKVAKNGKYTFYLKNKNEFTSVEKSIIIKGINGFDVDVPSIPELPQDANILDYIKYVFDIIFWLFNLLISLLSNLFKAVGSIGALLSSAFNWLPFPIPQLFIVGLIVTILCIFIKR